jgi:molybdopterin-guanine dinucleotide biosynthesis protein MobB
MPVWSLPFPILGFVAWSGTGKTTLLTKIIPLLNDRGFRIGTIKHAHHDFDIDHPGKDSFQLRKAGANPMLIASRRRWALMVETDNENEPELANLLRHLDPSSIDLVLVEGFKHEHFPKIEVHRSIHERPLLHTTDPEIIAVVSDIQLDIPLPCLNINDPASVAEFVISHCHLT